LIKGDITDFRFVKRALRGVEAVAHAAALVDVQFSIQNPTITNEINVGGTLNILRACRDLGVEWVVFASSAAVYGDANPPRKNERDYPVPMSPYAVSKLASEYYILVFNKLYGIKTTCLRYFNVYGSRQRADIHSSYGGVVSIFISRILKGLRPLIFGDGMQSRDFVHVDDVVEATILALSDDHANGQIFNVGTGKSISINQVAGILKKALDREDLSNEYMDSRPGDPRNVFADISKARRVLGFEPKVTVKEGLTNLARCFKNESA
jgi:UDP-glucose 4-epimerase